MTDVLECTDEQHTLFRCTPHNWICYGHRCPKCHPEVAAQGPFQATFAAQLRTRAAAIPSGALEAAARAIAATKRGVEHDHPSIDRVWHTYVGMAKSAISAFRTHLEKQG